MRNNLGQYSKKTGKVGSLLKALYILIALLVIVFMITYKKDANVPATAIVEANKEEVARLSPDVQAYMDSEEYKLEMELTARTRVLNKKSTEADRAYEAGVALLKETRDAEKLKIKQELEDIKKQELETAKSNTAVKGN